MTDSFLAYDQFLACSGPDRLQKILAKYELFKLTLDVPGDIVECGVWKASGLYTWAKLMRLLKPNGETRIIGFDFFEAERAVELMCERAVEREPFGKPLADQGVVQFRGLQCSPN